MITTKDREQTRKAKSVDVPAFFDKIGVGYEMLNEKRFCLIENRLMIWRKLDNNCWEFFDNRTKKNSDVIDFVRGKYNYGFLDAVKFINSKISQVDKSEKQENAFPILSADSKAYKYLTETRGVSTEKVDLLIRKKLIMQSKDGLDLIFPCFNPKKEAINIEIYDTKDAQDAGTLDSENPKKLYAFAIAVGKPETMYFFKDTIELLSFWSLMPRLKDVVLISMAGLRDEVVDKYVSYFPNSSICICVNKGEEGQKLYDSIKAKHELADLMLPEHDAKTWNECLQRHKSKNEALQQIREVS